MKSLYRDIQTFNQFGMTVNMVRANGTSPTCLFEPERFRETRQSLSSLINNEMLFIFFDLGLPVDDPLPSMNNQIVGAVNTPLRDLLRKHREMSSDDDIALLHEAFESAIKNEDGPME